MLMLKFLFVFGGNSVMSTIKIGESPKPPCKDLGHLPPKHIVYESGKYKHTCPSCGFVTIFSVPLISLLK